MSGRGRSVRSWVIAAARAALARLPDLARWRFANLKDFAASRMPLRACGLQAARHPPAGAGGSRLRAAAGEHRRYAAAAWRARRAAYVDAADDRDRRLAQCLRRGVEIRKPLARELGEAGFVIISGLALGVVVIEAAQRWDSLMTARMAAEQGREVFAVPGSPLDPRAAGTNNLLKQGATLLSEASDVIQAVAPIMERPAMLRLREDNEPLKGDRNAGDRAQIIALPGPTPLSIDHLIRMSGAPASIVRTIPRELS
jgi:hypothetical protein